MEHISPAVLGWMAGVIDLKGRLAVKKNKLRATPQYTLHVESKDFQVVSKLSEYTGTSPELKKPQATADFMRRQCTQHCPETHVHVHEGPYGPTEMPAVARWTVTGAAMVTVLFNTRPFQLINRGYDEACKDILKNLTFIGQGSGAVRASQQRLYNLGWRLPPIVIDSLFGLNIDDEEDPDADQG